MPSVPDGRRPGTPPPPDVTARAFTRLVEIVARLRAPDGCPWDREQTFSSIKPHTLEEVHEVIEAIDAGDDEGLIEELGDLLLQVILYAQIAADEERFDLVPVLEGIADKLVRRHPHVFGDGEAKSAEHAIRNWERLKHKEKKRDSLLGGVPETLPALARASRISEKAARTGYDWPRREMLFAKLREEVDELAAELFPEGRVPEVKAGVEGEVVADEKIEDPERLARAEEEIGDVLFVVANIARRWGINPEEALRKSNRKFERRFHFIEKALAVEGKTPHDASLEEMERHYQRGRTLEKNRR